NRLYGVLNNRLHKSRYVAGDEYTIADMICYPWTVNSKAQGQDIEEFKYFKRWFDEIGERPAVKGGMAGRTHPPPHPARPSAEDHVQPAGASGVGLTPAAGLEITNADQAVPLPHDFAIALLTNLRPQHEFARALRNIGRHQLGAGVGHVEDEALKRAVAALKDD